ncbi:tyrosinase family oxidase copper chaperone [Streptomyces sp. NPDC020403]|uniref:tyrosinase family oxidase copper chaperone n=1 Tax=unclassified Streptomyces TaxID=2593676 RepID=UPI0033F7C7B3
MDPNTSRDEEAGRRRPARRAVLRAAFTAAAVAGTGGALAPVLLRTPGQPDRPERTFVGPERFSEVYRGRDIRGTAGAVVVAAGAPHAGEAGAVAAAPDIDVRIDGRGLHVMRRADGSYLSAVNHYESFPTLLETARAAVDEIGTARLSAASPHTI